MRRMPALPALCALVATVGCGGSDAPPSPQAQVRATLTRLTDGVQDKDYAQLCKTVFAPNLASGLEEVGLTCPEALERAFKEVEEPQLSVDAVRVDGDEASAEVRTSALNQEASADTVRLVKVKAGWRVSSLGEGSASATPTP